MRQQLAPDFRTRQQGGFGVSYPDINESLLLARQNLCCSHLTTVLFPFLFIVSLVAQLCGVQEGFYMQTCGCFDKNYEIIPST